jgi:mannosyltransferase PIG-V
MDEGVLEQHAPARAVALDLEAEAERRLGWVVTPAAIAILSRTFSILLIAAWTTLGAGRADPLLAWDGQWYLGIARDGYHAVEVLGGHDFAFYPLWPMLIRASTLVGLPPDATAVVLANALFVVALVVLWRMLERRFDARTATGATALLAFAPPAFVFSMGYTESLFLLLGSLYFATSPTSPWRLPLAALAAITRITGLAIVVTALVRSLRTHGLRRRVALAAAACGVLGFAAWWGYVALLTGDPLGYLQGSPNWIRGSVLSELRLAVLFHPLRVLAWAAFVGLLLAGTAALYRRHRELCTYAATVLAIGLVPIAAAGLLHSVPRYAILAFPAFAGLASRLGSRTTLALVVAFAIAQVAFVGWVLPPTGTQAP